MLDPCGFDTVQAIVKLREDGTGIVAVAGNKLLKQVVRPAHGTGDDAVFVLIVIQAVAAVRLIGEDAADAFAQTITATLAVLSATPGQWIFLPSSKYGIGSVFGKTVSVCAAKTVISSLPAQFSGKITLSASSI